MFHPLIFIIGNVQFVFIFIFFHFSRSVRCPKGAVLGMRVTQGESLVWDLNSQNCPVLGPYLVEF
jgi:hypothetical protein